MNPSTAGRISKQRIVHSVDAELRLEKQAVLEVDVGRERRQDDAVDVLRLAAASSMARWRGRAM